MYRGRYQQGQEVPLGVFTRNASGAPTLPSAAPTYRVYNTAGTLVDSGSLPIVDRFGTTGMFGMQKFLGQPYPTGVYYVAYQWTVSSVSYAELDSFEVLGGGNRRGGVVAMEFLRRPQADFVVQNCFDGSIVKGRNPSV
jgi:hypothetical protein